MLAAWHLHPDGMLLGPACQMTRCVLLVSYIENPQFSCTHGDEGLLPMLQCIWQPVVWWCWTVVVCGACCFELGTCTHAVLGWHTCKHCNHVRPPLSQHFMDNNRVCAASPSAGCRSSSCCCVRRKETLSATGYLRSWCARRGIWRDCSYRYEVDGRCMRVVDW